LGSIVPGIANFFLSNSFTGGLMKSFLNVAPERNLPEISSTSLRKWYKKNYSSLSGPAKTIKSVYFFVDEFTNHNDTQIGIKAISLLKNWVTKSKSSITKKVAVLRFPKVCWKKPKNMLRPMFGFSTN
jgi:hypothetical protein